MNTKQKIAIIGTHGVGKTTLSFALAKHFKQLGKNVKIIQEVARSCPFPINEKMTKDVALWIFHEHSKKELEALKDHEIVIGDRSSFDSFAYAEYFNIHIPWQLMEYAQNRLSEYEKIIFVRPDLPIGDDGIRANDLHFQIGIDEILNQYIPIYNPIQIKSSQIFDEAQSWKQFCL